MLFVQNKYLHSRYKTIFLGGCSCPFLIHTRSGISTVNLHKSKAEIDSKKEQTTSEQEKHSVVQFQMMRFSYFISDLTQNSRQCNSACSHSVLSLSYLFLLRTKQRLDATKKKKQLKILFYPDNWTSYLLST